MPCARCHRDVSCWTFGYYAASHRGTEYLGSSGGVKEFEERYAIGAYHEVPLCRRDTLLGLAMTLTGLHLYAIVGIFAAWFVMEGFGLGSNAGEVALVGWIAVFAFLGRSVATHDDYTGRALVREAGDKVAIAAVTHRPPGWKGRIDGYVTRFERSRMHPGSQ